MKFGTAGGVGWVRGGGKRLVSVQLNPAAVSYSLEGGCWRACGLSALVLGKEEGGRKQGGARVPLEPPAGGPDSDSARSCLLWKGR